MDLARPGSVSAGEQLFLEPEHVLHHRQPRGYLTPSQGGSYLSSRQRLVTDSVFKVKSHVYSLEGQDCQYRQMFGSDLRAAVSLWVLGFGSVSRSRCSQVPGLVSRS